MAKQQLDIRAVLAILATLVGATAFCGEKLRATVIEGASLSFPALVWVIATTFLAAMALSAAVAALGIAVGALGQVPLPSWHSLSRVAFDFSLWLLYWLGIWGGLFTLSFMVFLEAQRFYPVPVAGLLGAVFAAASTVSVMRLLPRDVRNHMEHLNPYTRYGLLPGVLLFFVFSSFGHFVARSYRTFELALGSREVLVTSPLRVEARVSGRVLNLQFLSAWVEPTEGSGQRSFAVEFDRSSDGNYIGWVAPGSLSPGTYRVVLSFSNFAQASTLDRIGLWFNANNHLVRTAVFRVLPAAWRNGSVPPGPAL